MHGYYQSNHDIHIVLQYAECGDLLNDIYTKTYTRAQRFQRARLILAQLCQAVSYLEKLQVAHRDIKPENVLLTKKSSSGCDIKLCDFGWATWWKPGSYHNTLCGTPEFIPPEIASGETSYSPEFVDPWALGVLAFEIVEQTTPFRPDCDAQQCNISTVQRHTFKKIASFTGMTILQGSSEFSDFVNRLMQVEPMERMTASEALEHDFLRAASYGRTATTRAHIPSVAQRCQLFEKL